MVSAKIKHESVIPRLKRIEGQVRGVINMVESNKYCIDIVDQIHAAKKALDKAALMVMQKHIESCVTSAARSEKGGEKIDELMQSLDRFLR